MSSKGSIPGMPKQWETRATELLVSDVPLSQLNKLDSASKMTEQQFLCLRVLWPGSKKPNEFPKPSETTKARIDEVMANFPPFDAYLDHLRTPEKEYFDRKMGVFMLVMQAQRHIATDRKTMGLDYDSVAIRRSARVQNKPGPSRERTTTSASSSASSEAPSTSSPRSVISAAAPFGLTGDEKVIHEALLYFLRALIVSLPNMRCEWSFCYEFIKTPFGDNEMTARIGGCLMGIGIPDMFAIVEVKPRVRNRDERPQLL